MKKLGRVVAAWGLALGSWACSPGQAAAPASEGAPSAPPAAGQARAPQRGAGPRAVRALPTERLDRVLAKFATPRGVDYGGLRGAPWALADLRAYVEALADMPAEAPLADWLNAYNALVLHAVLARWPLKSVMDVGGFFKRAKHRVAGRARTLDELEHGVVRARFKDARVHFALNCAARSCPTLHGRAFRQPTLHATLDRLTRASLADPRHLRREGDLLRVSALFFWFRADFVRDGGGSVLGFLRKYAPRASLEGLTGDGALRELPYDWALNRVAPAAP